MRLLLLAHVLLAALPAAAQKPAADVVNFNQHWQFTKANDTTITAALFTKTGPWATVSLPHTPQIEPVVTNKLQWQGTCFYRRFFKVPSSGLGPHVVVQFGAAMHTADVYLNGQKLQRHAGGYLPFAVDISRQTKYGQENCLLGI